MDKTLVMEKLKRSGSFEEFIRIVEEEGLKLGKEEAEALWDKLNSSSEINDEDIAAVAGGVRWRKKKKKVDGGYVYI